MHLDLPWLGNEVHPSVRQSEPLRGSVVEVLFIPFEFESQSESFYCFENYFTLWAAFH